MRLSTDQVPTLPTGLSAAALLGAIRQGIAVTVFKTSTEQTASAQPESQPESGSELETKVLQLLANSALGKRELSAALGQKAVSGQLNKVVRKLLAADLIEPTVPNQLNSRLQQYRLKNAKRLTKANTTTPTISEIIP